VVAWPVRSWAFPCFLVQAALISAHTDSHNLFQVALWSFSSGQPVHGCGSLVFASGLPCGCLASPFLGVSLLPRSSCFDFCSYSFPQPFALWSSLLRRRVHCRCSLVFASGFKLVSGCLASLFLGTSLLPHSSCFDFCSYRLPQPFQVALWSFSSGQPVHGCCSLVFASGWAWGCLASSFLGASLPPRSSCFDFCSYRLPQPLSSCPLEFKFSSRAHSCGCYTDRPGELGCTLAVLSYNGVLSYSG